MQAGKLPLEFLSRLLDKIDLKDPRVVLGAKAGEDAALIDFGDRYLVTKTDPITFATDLIGWYVVQVNANDLAVMGATPKWMMVTLLLPEGTSDENVEEIFDQLLSACESLNIALVGGHTEVTYALPRPIAIGAMMGEVTKERVVFTSGARPGDAIVLTKGIAIEGTSLLAREASGKLIQAGVSPNIIARAREFLTSPGIGILKDASIACNTVKLTSMHDPTEGGLATALLELATSANVGLIVDEEIIPVLQECRIFCDALGLNPMGLIGSGSLLATLAPQDAPKLIDALAHNEILAYEIGRITSHEDGLKIKTKEGTHELPRFERDELARLLTE